MSKVLAVNEEAYLNRYGTSLNEILNKLSDAEKERYITEAQVYINSDIPDAYRFSSDEILRIIIGYRSGLQLMKAFDGAPQVVRVLVWEPDAAVFAAGCIYEDISKYINDKRIVIALGNGEDILKHSLRETAFENNILHRHIYAYGEYLKPDNVHVKTFLKIFEEFYVDIVSQMHFRKQYEHLVYENMLYSVNVLNNNYVTNQLFEAITTRDIPVIIVAAGPSLMKNCLELKRAKNRAVIVAVAHAMKTLTRNSIQPDLVATADPASPYFLDYDKKKEYTLLCCVYNNKEFQKNYDGRLIFYGFPMCREFFNCRRTEAEVITEYDTGSVATDIMSLFAAVGFKRFILAGQDLAYGDDGLSHTEGQKEVRKKDEKGIFPETEGIYGGMLKTRDDWILFRQYYEKRIREDSTLEIIDATEGGALIHGSKVMKLRDAIDEYCTKEYPIDVIIRNIPKGDEEEKKYIDVWFKQQIEMNDKTATNLDRIIVLNKEILNLWGNKDLWDDEFSANCKRYDIMYHIVMEGNDGVPIREYCRSDIERYIEDALSLEGDDNIEARMRREQELFVIMREKLKDMQEFVQKIRHETDYRN